MKRTLLILSLVFYIVQSAFAQDATPLPLVTNIAARDLISLNGKWNYVIDPLENGYYDYRLKPFDTNGFFENKKAQDNELVEYNLDASPIMDIPSDWNTKDLRLFVYEGTVWFKRDFTLNKKSGTRYVIYFGAVNYDAKVWVNGKKAGEHVGGYTPFNFDITDLANDGDNFVVIKVDNKRHKDNVPTNNMDWWNYGGITREVYIAQLPEVYIEDYRIELGKDAKSVCGYFQLNNSTAGQNITVEFPELKLKKQFTTNADGLVNFQFSISKFKLWTPETPKLYDLIISHNSEKLTDRVGFRTVETQGKKILLNGKHIFLRGVSIHEEAPFRHGRAWSKQDAVTLLTWAKEMGCNYVRLAHYPHNETMVRTAEEMGLLVWSEIPVYWTISWKNEATYQNAERQLHDMIRRDKNRCNIIIWSIANETPHSDDRDVFLARLARYARTQDTTRLISMAMEITRNGNGNGDKIINVNDNLNEYVDVISFNQYMGWYWGVPQEWTSPTWNIPYNKPVIISEFGGEALAGFHGDKLQRWTEEYQAELYRCNLEMLEHIDGLSGLSPWILVDFYSPRRQLPNVQDFFNRKGLISSWGEKKQAFSVMKNYYEKRRTEYED
ncbi:MAG: beta galactosidase jelly roll domain-containing protein [Prevotellaceae bacterium]|jgi:beta-glucuronidase|nr:beta galactosidase jelly roll domain-containing protein [Prevotellaceae bacterium]